jgi:GT2 family glycosyltransferase
LADRVKVSIIIITYNSGDVLSKCLDKLKTAIAKISSELIIVDNNSDENPTDQIKQHFPDARIVINDENYGFGRSCNQAAALAGGEYLLLLNPDALLDEDAIEKLIDVYESKPGVGQVVPRIRFPSGRYFPTCRNFPTIWNTIFSRGSFLFRLFQIKSSSKSDKYEYTIMRSMPNVTPVPAISGTIVLIRKKIFDEVGGFDERFFMYMEDTDLSLRILDAGYQNLYVPAAGAVHYWRQGSDTSSRRRDLMHHRSFWKYFTKHHPGVFTFLILPFLLILNYLIILIIPQKKLSEVDK